MGALVVETSDFVFDLPARQAEFRARATRDRARIQVLMRIVAAVITGAWSETTSPAAAVAKVKSEAESNQVMLDADQVAAAVSSGNRELLDEALEQLRYDDNGYAAQSGAFDPGLLDRLWLAAIDNPLADATIVTGVAARTAVGASVPEAQTGRDQALVDKGKKIGNGLQLGIGAVLVVVVIGVGAWAWWRFS